jgi:hypothetical protein
VVACLSRICLLKADVLRGTDKEVANKFEMYIIFFHFANVLTENISNLKMLLLTVF